MPLFENFPYTNFHEMNLDFILKQVKSIPVLEATVQELAGKYNDMYNKVSQLSEMYDSFADEIYADIEAWKQSGAEYINDALNSMYDEMNAAFAIQNARIDLLETRMDNLEQSVAEAYYMDSPFTGENVPMRQVIYELASLHMTDALTATEYDAADLTAAAYEALDLTAYAYDWNGALYIS